MKKAARELCNFVVETVMLAFFYLLVIVVAVIDWFHPLSHRGCNNTMQASLKGRYGSTLCEDGPQSSASFEF
jgi:hypothetical protein